MQIAMNQESQDLAAWRELHSQAVLDGTLVERIESIFQEALRLSKQGDQYLAFWTIFSGRGVVLDSSIYVHMQKYIPRISFQEDRQSLLSACVNILLSTEEGYNQFEFLLWCASQIDPKETQQQNCIQIVRYLMHKSMDDLENRGRVLQVFEMMSENLDRNGCWISHWLVGGSSYDRLPDMEKILSRLSSKGRDDVRAIFARALIEKACSKAQQQIRSIISQIQKKELQNEVAIKFLNELLHGLKVGRVERSHLRDNVCVVELLVHQDVRDGFYQEFFTEGLNQGRSIEGIQVACEVLKKISNPKIKGECQHSLVLCCTAASDLFVERFQIALANVVQITDAQQRHDLVTQIERWMEKCISFSDAEAVFGIIEKGSLLPEEKHLFLTILARRSIREKGIEPQDIIRSLGWIGLVEEKDGLYRDLVMKLLYNDCQKEQIPLVLEIIGKIQKKEKQQELLKEVLGFLGSQKKLKKEDPLVLEVAKRIGDKDAVNKTLLNFFSA